ncbi:MFS transporter [Actinomadura harenae]|uniref:MFS transporter n=1 Tax=Actinomadura harenae TaxID=2483351 RepID=A0A3M2MD10_9ACTN|nr:MFS transporter [Actinomadura harenae]
MRLRDGTDTGAAAPGGRERLFAGEYAAPFAAFTALTVLTALSGLAVVPTLPVAVRALDGLWLYPLVASAFVAAGLVGGVIGGAWSDRSGPGRPLAAGLALAVATLVVSGTAGTVWQLAAGRFLDGVAAGMIVVATNAAIAQTFPDRLRPRALALLSAAWVGPSLIGPPLAGLVVSWWSWRWVFLGLAALMVLPGLAVIASLGRLPRRDAPAGAESPGLVVALAVSVGAGLGQYALSGRSAVHLACGMAALLVLAAFVRRMVPPGTWRAAPGLPATVLLNGLASGTFFTLEAMVPLLLNLDGSVAPAVAGLAFTGSAVAWALSSWAQSRWLAGRPRHLLVAGGAVLLALATGGAAIATATGLPAWIPASALVVAAVGMGATAPTLTVLSLGHAPSGRTGYAGSAMQTSQNLGQIGILALASALLGTAVSAASAGSVARFGPALGVLVVPSLAIVILAARARSTRAS